MRSKDKEIPIGLYNYFKKNIDIKKYLYIISPM